MTASDDPRQNPRQARRRVILKELGLTPLWRSRERAAVSPLRALQAVQEFESDTAAKAESVEEVCSIRLSRIALLSSKRP